jgi:hypothetical protein
MGTNSRNDRSAMIGDLHHFFGHYMNTQCLPNIAAQPKLNVPELSVYNCNTELSDQSNSGKMQDPLKKSMKKSHIFKSSLIECASLK